MSKQDRSIIAVLALACIMCALALGGCSGSITKAQAIQAALDTVQLMLGKDIASAGQYMRANGYGDWPTDVAGWTLLGTTLVAAIDQAPQATSGTMSLKAAVGKVRTPQGSGQQLLDAFHASDGR